MCGILLIASLQAVDEGSVQEAAAAFDPLLRARGPDHCGSTVVTSAAGASDGTTTTTSSSSSSSLLVRLHLAASLLQLRGREPSTSPLVDSAGNVLCFNGEVFGGLPVPEGGNDGKALIAALQLASAPCPQPAAATAQQQQEEQGDDQQQALPGVLSRLRGPWALLYWQQSAGRLWFGRDVMGKRSLLLQDPRALSCSQQQQAPWHLVLSSVAPHHQLPAAQSLEGAPAAAWVEVPPGLYSIDAAQLQQLLLHPPPGRSAADASAAGANRGVRHPADLCALLPGLCHHPWQHPELLQLQQYGRGTPPELKQQQQQQPLSADPEHAAQLLLPVLEAAVRVRCLAINDRRHTGSQHCNHQHQQQQRQQQQHDHPDSSCQPPLPLLPPAPVLILFSGGVDSTLVAALAHRALPPGAAIDLTNVCFDGGKSADRAAARAATLELAAYAPDRPWRLIEVDSSLAEVDSLAPRIRGLLQPSATVMDWNIGSALWLAARAAGRALVPVRKAACCAAHAGTLSSSSSGPEAAADGCWVLLPVPGGGGAHQDACAVCSNQQQQQQQQQWQWQSAARVVLLGHGADEQCGGYGRHRTKFREAGTPGVEAELTLDTTRLWLRNLGRDDRLVADHGREARHPFLDEGVMRCLLGLPLSALADLRQPPGVGDKRVLRALLEQLGLPTAARREKRAIQFGSRLAQLSNLRDFGSNRAANARSAGGLLFTGGGPGVGGG